MRFRIHPSIGLVVFVLPCPTISGEESKTAGAFTAPNSGTLEKLAAAHSNLSTKDPREFPMKIRSLLSDPYTFFRGTCDLFHEACAAHWEEYRSGDLPRGLLHGDVHIGNLGTINVGSLKQPRAQFGLVDLDETFEGPLELDLLRAMTALRFAAGAAGVETSEVQWSAVGEMLCRTYVAGIKGEIQVEDLAGRHEAVTSVLRRAAGGTLESYVARYTEENARFRSVRRSGSGIRDLMEPVPAEIRRELLEVVFPAVRRDGVPTNHCDLGFEEFDGWSAAVLDVRRWTRVGSSGSQGVHKYLLLVRIPAAGNVPVVVEVKEQPGAAAALARLTEGSRPAERAAFVAAAHRRLLGGPSDCVGSFVMAGKSYLLRIKGPWGEDLEISDFKSIEKRERIPAMAAIMGQTMGIAHRRALVADARLEVAEVMVIRVRSLADTLVRRSEVLESTLRAAFDDLRQDPAAVGLAKLADTFLAGIP